MDFHTFAVYIIFSRFAAVVYHNYPFHSTYAQAESQSGTVGIVAHSSFPNTQKRNRTAERDVFAPVAILAHVVAHRYKRAWIRVQAQCKRKNAESFVHFDIDFPPSSQHNC